MKYAMTTIVIPDKVFYTPSSVITLKKIQLRIYVCYTSPPFNMSFSSCVYMYFTCFVMCELKGPAGI